MITTENKNFLRIILLLYDAASFILRHIVVRELEKQGDDLDNLLNKDKFENKLKHKLHFGKSQVEKLFPSYGKTDIQTWDSQMLAVVSLLIFRSTLSSDEKYHIKFIKLTRNNVAHKPSASYLEEDFVDEEDGIVKAITILASSFDTTVQESCSKLISSYCSDPLDTHVQLAIKHLGEDTNNVELLRQILDAVNQKHEIVRKDIQEYATRIEGKINLTEKKICDSQENVVNSLNGIRLDIGNVESKVTESKEKSSQELKQINTSLTNHIAKEAEKVSQKVDSNNSLLQEVQRNQNEHTAKLETKLEELKQLFEQKSRIGGHCSKQIKFGTHTHLTVDGPTQEWINTVETVLKSVFDILLNKIEEPGQTPETEKAVEEFLNFIKGFKGVELKAVERKCILLAFECLTFESLRELIEFINSNEFHIYLVNIARALEKDLQIPEQILISSEIPISSLQLVVDDKSFKHESEKGIVLSFECTSINGLDAFWRLFVKGEATPYIDKIAATLSSEVRVKTSISTSVNQQEFEDALTHLEATVNRDKETVLFKPNTETMRQSSDFELDIDTLETRTVYMSQDSHTKLIDPPMPPMDTFQNIQAGLKQPNAKQHVNELESEDEHMLRSRLHMRRPRFSSYRHSAYKSKDSHTKGNDSPINPLITSQNIQSGFKQPSAKQDISELKSDDQNSWSSLYRQSRYPKLSFEADEESEPSRIYKHSIPGDLHPNPTSPPSSSYWLRSDEQELEAVYGKASYTQDISDRIDGGDTPVGCRLRKSVDDTLSARVVHMLCVRMRSVGLLIGKGRPCGTVFRVGSKFLMTALHCVNNLKDLENNEVFVDFNSSLLLPVRKVYHLTNRKIVNENLDFVILEISDPDEQLPEALELDKDITDVCSEMNSVSLIGYGHPDKLEKTLYPDCKLISANALRTLETEGKQWLKENKSGYRTALILKGNDPDLVNIGYRGINMPGKFYFHCFMQHSASGAPAITTIGSKHKVVGMLTHGLPEVYFYLPKLLQHGFETNLMCKVASMMSSIYKCVKACEPAVAADLFK